MRLALVSLVLLLATGVAANPDDDASAPGPPVSVGNPVPGNSASGVSCRLTVSTRGSA